MLLPLTIQRLKTTNKTEPSGWCWGAGAALGAGPWVTEGYPPDDMSCFVAWGIKLLADQGPAAFLQRGYFADYPPGYLWVLGFVGRWYAKFFFAIAYESGDDLSAAGAGAVGLRLCRRRCWLCGGRESGTVGRQMALALAAFTAFDPLLLFDTAVWKQIDGAFALPLLLCFLLLEQRRYLPAAVWFGLALAIKPQALLFIRCWRPAFWRASRWNRTACAPFCRCFGGAALALLVPLATGIPFFGLAICCRSCWKNTPVQRSGYPYATINGFNWLAALGATGNRLSEPALFGMSWQQLGFLQHPAGHGWGLPILAVCSSRRAVFAAAAGGLLRHRHFYAGPLHA